MCNLYSITKSQAAIIEFTGAVLDSTGNLPSMPGVFPDYTAILRTFWISSGNLRCEGSKIAPFDFHYLCTWDGRKIAARTVGLYVDLMGPSSQRETYFTVFNRINESSRSATCGNFRELNDPPLLPWTAAP